MTSFARAAALLLAWPSLALAQTAPTPPPAPAPAALEITVVVVGTTPLPGVGVTLDKIPSPVQAATALDMEKSGAIDLSGFMKARLSAVHVNDIEGNPFTTDVNYRGYTASPVLGTPQGLSVYMDGVRLNQPFGDVVSWDLIPQRAISSVALMPGSNPVFGLNTLGGALSIQTKDGRSDPGTAVQALYGQFRRRALEFEHGGSRSNGLNWYLTGNLFGERGWREDSPSDVRQIFGKVGWAHLLTDISVTLAQANNSLTGNGLQEQRFLEQDRAGIYTKPDPTDKRSTLVNVSARHSPSQVLTLSGNAYYRDIHTDGSSADVNEASLDQSIYQPGAAERAALTAAGYTGVPVSGATAANTPFPSWRCIGNVLLKDEPGEKCNGLINRAQTVQHNAGLSGQVTLLSAPTAPKNQLTVGAAYDHSRVGFLQSTEIGYVNPDRSITGLHVFADGVNAGTVDGVPFDHRIDLDGRIQTWSLFATDTRTIGRDWHLTLSGRYNRTAVHNRDQIDPGGGPGSLDGDHIFSRFNPAAGLTFTPSARINAYIGYSEGSRAPTSIELGCADPNQPCKLPNAMAGDPPLSQVRTGTWEAGVRGSGAGDVTWNVSAFFAENRDDLLFVTSTQTGFGFFKNFGRTRREGLEVGVSRRVGRVMLTGGYTWLNATYQSAETVSGTGNSTNDAAMAGAKGLEGTIDIAPGDRIPLIPQHMVKATADVEITKALSLDLDLIGVSSAYARGNENNQHTPDGTFYLGPGASAGYAVLDLGARYQMTKRVQCFVQINNVLNRRYETAAQLGPTAFTSTGTFIARPFPAVGADFPVQQATFFAPGAPTTAWGGVRVKF